MTFLNAILNQSKKHDFPFDHWEYNNALSVEAISEIINTDVPDVSKYNHLMTVLEQLMVERLNLEKELLLVEKQ